MWNVVSTLVLFWLGFLSFVVIVSVILLIFSFAYDLYSWRNREPCWVPPTHTSIGSEEATAADGDEPEPKPDHRPKGVKHKKSSKGKSKKGKVVVVVPTPAPALPEGTEVPAAAPGEPAVPVAPAAPAAAAAAAAPSELAASGECVEAAAELSPEPSVVCEAEAAEIAEPEIVPGLLTGPAPAVPATGVADEVD